MKAGKRNNMALSEYTIAEHNHLAVYAHPMFGSNNYLPDWLRNSGYSDDELMEITKERIRIILTRYKGRIDIVDGSAGRQGNGGKRTISLSAWGTSTTKFNIHLFFMPTPFRRATVPFGPTDALTSISPTIQSKNQLTATAGRRRNRYKKLFKRFCPCRPSRA